MTNTTAMPMSTAVRISMDDIVILTVTTTITTTTTSSQIVYRFARLKLFYFGFNSYRFDFI
jgi:energy-coupling factor transporter transmembrane protein EcfT